MVDGATSFIRNLLVARVLAPDDFGIGTTFAITVTFLETISNLGMEQLLIQAKDGDEPRLQGTAHVIMTMRGLFIGVAICLGAPYVVRLFDVPEAEWAFKVLAIAPLIKGFTHLDIFRLQRQLRYGRMVISTMAGRVIVTVAAWPVAQWYGDYVALLWISLAMVIVTTAMSHVVRERPYRWHWDGRYAVRFLTFGWPLAINGLLLFGTLQGDRAVVGVEYQMAMLGAFSIAAQLTAMPTAMIWGVVNQLSLPLLSRRQDNRPEFDRLFRLISEYIAFVSLSMGVCFVLLGRHLIVALYGQKYIAAGLVVGWLGAAQAMRLLRGLTGLAAISLGDARTLLISNIFRSVGLLCAIVLARMRMGVAAIAVCGLAGEVVGLGVAILRLRMRHGVSIALSLRPITIVTTAIFVSIGAEHWILYNEPSYVVIPVALLLEVGFLMIGVFMLPLTREKLKELWRLRGSRMAVAHVPLN